MVQVDLNTVRRAIAEHRVVTHRPARFNIATRPSRGPSICPLPQRSSPEHGLAGNERGRIPGQLWWSSTGPLEDAEPHAVHGPAGRYATGL